jgi:hypothetical protein
MLTLMYGSGGRMSDKVVQIAKFQGKQKTPKEALEFLLEMADKIDQIIVSYVDKDGRQFYLPASIDRDYRNSDIHWDLSQLANWFICNN